MSRPAQLLRGLAGFRGSLPEACPADALFSKLITHQLLKSPMDFERGVHGFSHWGRVVRNAEQLARRMQVEMPIAGLFGLLHDAFRRDEDLSPRHGADAATWIERNPTLMGLDSADVRALALACRFHSEGFVDPEEVAPGLSRHQRDQIMLAWDGDRLDLGRVDIFPDPERLCTAVARSLLQDGYRLSGVHRFEIVQDPDIRMT